MTDCIIAIDPGANGAIAVRTPKETSVHTAPATRGDYITLLRKIVDTADEHGWTVSAVMEQVAAFIPDGGASMMFQYGRNVERPGCILETLDVRIIEIQPKAWQKKLGLGKSERIPGPKMPKSLSPTQKRAWKEQNRDELESVKRHNASAKRDWKNKLCAEAQRRHPTLKLTLKTCDAILILESALI